MDDAFVQPLGKTKLAHLQQLCTSWQISAEDADACPSACNDDVGCCLDWVAAGEAIAVTSLAEVQSIAEAQSNAVSFNALDPPSASVKTEMETEPSKGAVGAVGGDVVFLSNFGFVVTGYMDHETFRLMFFLSFFPFVLWEYT